MKAREVKGETMNECGKGKERERECERRGRAYTSIEEKEGKNI